MQVWGIRAKFGGAIENNEFKLHAKARRTHAYIRIVFFSKELWDHILQESGN